MRAMLRGLALGLTAIAIGGTSAYAGTLETVTVTGSRAVSEKSVGSINCRCGHSRSFPELQR